MLQSSKRAYHGTLGAKKHRDLKSQGQKSPDISIPQERDENMFSVLAKNR